MSSKKMFYLMVGVLGVLSLSVVATVVLGDIILQKQSAKLVSLKLDNQVIDSQEASLAQAKIDIQKYSELETIAKQIVPQEKDQALATREIINLADLSGVKIASINFPSSSLGQATPKSTTPNTTATATSPTQTSTSVTQVKPVEGISGLYSLDISVTSDDTSPTTYSKLSDFLSRLEQNRRTSQVSQISIQPDAQNRSQLKFALTITIYIKP